MVCMVIPIHHCTIPYTIKAVSYFCILAGGRGLGLGEAFAAGCGSQRAIGIFKFRMKARCARQRTCEIKRCLGSRANPAVVSRKQQEKGTSRLPPLVCVGFTKQTCRQKWLYACCLVAVSMVLYRTIPMPYKVHSPHGQANPPQHRVRHHLLTGNSGDVTLSAIWHSAQEKYAKEAIHMSLL